MTTGVPAAIAEAVRGWPVVGAWEQMLPLLTVDDDGGVRVCLLSRAELDTDGATLAAVVASRSTAANLRRDGRATLMVVTGSAAVYARLGAAVLRDFPDGPLGVRFVVGDVKVDGVGVGLEPARYFVDAGLAENEAWGTSRFVLEELLASAND